MLLFLKESIGLLLAIFLGLYSYRRLGVFHKILFFQTIAAIVSYGCAYFVASYQKYQGDDVNNQWVFNLYIILELFILTFAATKILTGPKNKVYISIGMGVTLLTFLYQMSSAGFYEFANITAITEGIFIVIVCLLVIINSWLYQTKEISRSEVFSIAGLALYFAGYIPFIGTMHNLLVQDEQMTSRLYEIMPILSNIRYLLLAVAFWLINSRSTK